MAKVREITYYAPAAEGYDKVVMDAMKVHMKSMWGGEVVFGTVFSGEYVGHGYTTIDFDSWKDFANLQDNWASNNEWLAFLTANASKITAAVAREVVVFD